METRRRIYFAHSRQDYGSLSEKKALNIIFGIYPNHVVFNPGSEANQKNFKRLLTPGLPVKEYMKPFFSVIDECDMLVFTALEGNKVGKGTYEEIMYAFSRKLPVFYLKLLDCYTEIMLDQVTKLHEGSGKKSWKAGYAKIEDRK